MTLAGEVASLLELVVQIVKNVRKLNQGGVTVCNCKKSITLDLSCDTAKEIERTKEG